MTHKANLAGKDIDHGRPLAHIRLLVLGAFVSATLAGITLFISVMHVMSTTDELSMAEERRRAASIADMLPHVPDHDLTRAIAALGMVAGLDGLAVAPAPASGPLDQSIPLIGDPLGGQFLTWRASSPGSQLLLTHAPTRVPLILGFVGGVLACLLAMLRHVRRIERQRLRAEDQALRDHLTGLPNRPALDAELARLAAGEEEFSLFALDLDRFKPVNDLFGHHAGDMAIVEVGQRLVAQLGEGAMLARIGGDEFVAIIRRDRRQADLVRLAEACIAAIGVPLDAVGRNVSVGISIGIVENGLAQPPATLLKQADRALYEAKRRNGGAYCFSTGSRSRAAGRADARPRARRAA